MRVFLVLFIVILGGMIGLALVRSPGTGELGWFSVEPARTEVRIEQVKRERVIETVAAPGDIEPLTKVDISAEVSARIDQLPFREGDRVARGDLVVKLDDRDLAATLASAEARRDAERFRLESERARLIGLQSNLEYARKQLQRDQELHASGDIPRKQLDDALEHVEDLDSSLKAAVHSISVLQSSLAAAEAEISLARESLADAVIQSPIDGVLTALNAEVGEMVLVGTMNNPGTVILTVADLSRMIMKAQVAESDIAKVARGQQAKIRINAYQDEVFDGEVRHVALQRTETELGASYFEVEIELTLNGRQLLSGLAANVEIEIAAREGVAVPIQAVVERPVAELPPEVVESGSIIDRRKKDVFVVFRVLDGKAVCTPVKTGTSDWTRTVIQEGLAEGDAIVTGPYKVLRTIRDGDLVKAIKADEVERTAADSAGDGQQDDAASAGES